MSRETNPQDRQQEQGTAKSGAGTSSASTGTTASRRDAGAAMHPGSDRERPLDTGREEDRGARSGAVATRRPGAVAPPFGGSPFVLMNRMAEDMDRLFDQFGFGRTGLGIPSFGSLLGREPWSGTATRGREALTPWSPQVELFRRGDDLVIRADLPGMKKEDVRVEVDDDVLVLSGERREELEDRGDDFYRSERSYGRFERAIPLPEGVDAAQCNASYRDGVLEVTLPAPKVAERKARRIDIR